jgi:hypothetical protein
MMIDSIPVAKMSLDPCTTVHLYHSSIAYLHVVYSIITAQTLCHIIILVDVSYVPNESLAA